MGSINGVDVAKLFDWRKAVSKGTSESVVLGVVGGPPGGHHHREQSYDSTGGNLYVQPPSRRRGTPTRPPLPGEFYFGLK